jgi:thiosulfate reductase/polysulfide reductase chain A
MKTHSICRLCSACCPIEVETEQGKWVSAIRKSTFPAEQQLVCPKLEKAADIIYSPARLAKPLVKIGGQGFKEESWDEAMDIVAQRLLFCKREYGAQSVCWLRGMAADWGAPWDYVNRLMNAYGSPNSIGNGSICFVGRDFAHTAYSDDSATRFRRKPPPCSDSKRQGIPIHSATPGRSVATLVF